MSSNKAKAKVSLKSKILTQGGIGGALRLFSLVTGLLTAIILARLLGAEGLGIYASALAILTLLILPLEFGLPALIIREVAKDSDSMQSAESAGLFYFSGGFLAASFIPLALLGYLVISLSPWSKQITFHAYWWLILLYILFSGIGAIASAFLSGAKALVLAQFPSLLLRPLFLLISLGLIYFFWEELLTPLSVLFAQTISVFFATLVSVLFLLANSYSSIRSVRPLYKIAQWARSAWKLGMINGIRRGQPQILIYILSLLSAPEAVGYLRICQRGASLVSFGTSVITTTTAPYVSSLLDTHHHRLQRLLTQAAALMTAWALVCLVVIIIFGEDILGLVFGEEFQAAYVVFVIFCAVELIKAYFGMSMIVLNMARQEVKTLSIMTIGLLICVIGTIILAPNYAALGCAVAYAISALWMYGMASYKAKSSLNLNTGVAIKFFRGF